MDRNQFLGLILMLSLITIYFWFFAPEVPEPQTIDNQPVAVDSVSVPNQPVAQAEQLSDSAKSKLNELKYGLFSDAADGVPQSLVQKAGDLSVTFSSQGGRIINVELTGYKTYDEQPLNLFNENHSLNIYFDHLSRQINLADLFFEPSVKKMGDSTQVIYTLDVNGSQVQQIYTLYSSGYQIGYQLKSNGFDKQIDAKDLNFFWGAKLAKVERELKDARNRTTVRYYALNGDADDLGVASQDHEEEQIGQPVKWLAFGQKFFTSAIIADNSFANAFITQDVPMDEDVVKAGTIQASIPYTDLASNTVGFTFYFGPNDYNVLKNVTDGFSDNVNLGWLFLPFINKYLIIPIFNFLEMFIGNYGLIIVIMVIIIRILISPLTYKSHISMAKMRVLKPELDAIKERVGDDMQKVQTAQMDLYRKAGINPLSGCIPVLLQFPILVSLFYFIPSAIELRLIPFLWAEDMSSYDSILNLPFTIPFYGSHVSLFTLLMAGSTVLYTMANSQVTSVQGPMKTMQYIMPVMLLFFFNSYPSGLSFYYFISNLVSYGQMVMFRKFIDEGKILKLMEENKKKNANKKKSKFQQRLEDAMKANQEAQKKGKKK
ncbi:MAG: membrane protein insertase YidC [Cyclobacteriaceae bacterium]